ncbi:hypothetical protein DFH27DRAFT_388837 [Peziza echinospora]|nr:hypothetical protein DFH27DRAFT_388837 [Peziza echinospora]
MEGWLQVPPERNLMGRAAWKVRYVVFGRDTSSSRAYPTSPARPTSAVDRHSYSHSPSESITTITNDVRNTFFLTIYKHKNDLEPISRHSIQDIASCYVGDLGYKQKKQVIMPTLIIHLRNDQPLSSPRSFRRRSNDNPYASKSTPTALFFRPAPETSDTLQQWQKEIQIYLNMCSNPQGSSTNQNPTSPIDDRFPDAPHTSTSLFFVNGEPNTALLSPSLRSKCSDLSSIPSDRHSISSSSLSELPSPRVDEHAQEFHGRKALHIATNSADFEAHVVEDRPLPSGAKEPQTQPRRETILDRYFSCYPSPITSTPERPMSSSIARFEALMDELESKNPAVRNNRAASLASLSERSATLQELELPVRIPTPTLRALEFVSTGVYHPEDIPESTESSRRNSLHVLNDNRRLSVSMYSNLSRRNSDSSIGGASSVAGAAPSSVVGSLSGGFASSQGQLSYASSSGGKRHSISDFSARNVSGSGYYSTGSHGISRPGSISDFTHDFSDEATLQKLATAHNFHSRNNRPPPPVLMHEFLF